MDKKLYFMCDFQDLLIDKILNRLSNFIKYNPDDLNRSIFKTVIEGAISEITNISIDEIDKKFESYAKIRIYSEGKKGVHLKTDYYDIFIPDLEMNANNLTQDENCYVYAFFLKLYECFNDTDKLNELLTKKDSEVLKEIFNKSIQFATNALIYKVSKKRTPSKEELEKFTNTLK